MATPDLVVKERRYYLGTFFLVLLGCGFTYWGARAFDPSLTVIERPLILNWMFHLVKDLPPFLRGGIILAIGVALLALAAAHIRVWLWPRTLLSVDADGVAIGDRRLAWSGIGAIDAGKKKIGFLPADGAAPLQLDPRASTHSVDQIVAAVARYRPDLAAGPSSKA